MDIKKTELFTFKDILKQENYVICDSSVFSPSGPNWYWEGVYEAKNFAEIDSEYVKGEAEHLKYFTEFLANQNVYVVPGVCLELQRVRETVADKIKYLKMETKKYSKWGHHKGENKINLLQEVHDMFHESCMEAKRVSFLPKQRQEYNNLERIVMNVTEQTGAKIDFDEIYIQRTKPKKIEDLHTDEQTVTVALYLSVIENRKGCILTNDSDIGRILPNTLSYFFIPGIANLIIFSV